MPTLKVAAKRPDANVDSGGVRILSRPGKPLVVGMKADMTKSLIQATAAINGDVLAPIVTLDVPAVSKRPATDRGTLDVARSNVLARHVASPHTKALPRGLAHPRAAMMGSAAIAKTVHSATLAHSVARAQVRLHNVDAIAAARAATASIPHGIGK